jgi:cell division protein FtsQ
MAHLAIAGVLLFAAVRIFGLITSLDELALGRIEIEGAHRASPESIRTQLAPYLGRNILDLNLGEVAAASARDPWTLHASAKRVFPDTLRVRIAERTPSALALIGGIAHVVDTTGYVIRAAGPGATDDLPVLTGLDGLGEEQLIAALRVGVARVERLRRAVPDWLEEISEIDLGRHDRIAVSTVDRGPTILLDPGRIERNLREYLELRRDIGRRAGPLRTVDLRWQDHISVTPANRASFKQGS